MIISAKRGLFLFSLCALSALLISPSLAQKRPATTREFLLQYKGKEIQIMDKTGGIEQYVTGDPTQTYTLTLQDVQTDHIIVSRKTGTDKRTFLYPLSVIRRIIFMYDGKPYDKILLEMY